MTRTQTPLTQAARRFESAYAAHDSERGLPVAFRLYKEVLAFHPGEPEADYSQIQLHNIAIAIVPRQELLDAQLQPATARVERSDAKAAEKALVS